jgi:hypothetical protein
MTVIEYFLEIRWLTTGLTIAALLLAVQPDPRKILPSRRRRP